MQADRTYAPTPARDALIQRMLSFKGCFDGYPSMTCSDDALIDAALREHASIWGADDPNAMHAPALLSFWASEAVQTREQYQSAHAFILSWFTAAWECNMSEGENPVHQEVNKSLVGC